MSPFRHEQNDYTSVQRRLQSVLPANDNSPSTTSGTIQANEGSRGKPITSIKPVAIGTEELSEDISPTDVQSHVTADRFLSPIALISADENRLVKNGDKHLARCLIPVDFLCWSEPVPIFHDWDRKPVLSGFVAVARVFFPYQSVEKRGRHLARCLILGSDNGFLCMSQGDYLE